MNLQTFIAKWQTGSSADALSERAGAQAHFLDLCELLNVEKPSNPDNYCFERGAQRTGAGRGWADVWKRGHFAWEYKAPGVDLSKALKQLMTYALALDNPPLLVVSDRRLIEIHTHFTGAPSDVHTIRLEDTGSPENLEKLRWLFESPDRFRPSRDNRQITEEAARAFAELAQSLRSRFAANVGNAADSQRIAHFLTQCLFCLFAEDADLLPRGLFLRLLDKSQTDSARLDSRLRELFTAMQKGGDFALEDIAYFNGGLFETVDPLPLTDAESRILLAAAKLNWNAIDPAIFGTLFERGLDPKKRSQLGAHYTDPTTIMRLVEPTVVRPLTAEWETIRARIAELSTSFGYVGKKKDTPNAARKDGQALFMGFLERLKNFRVLDPACGSGNFLYLTLKSLKELEHKANLDAEALGLQRQVSIEVSPANVLGIELNEYAAELARVTVWIGELQWMRAHGYPVRQNPILDRLDHVENRDALINLDGAEADWPACDAIVGNPPFLGGSKKGGELGRDYFDALNRIYDERVPGGADLVCYWFEKARAHIEAGQCTAAGLVATNSIRGGSNRKVLDRIVESGRIFDAWSDEAWVNDGAAVRVSLVSFTAPSRPPGGLEPKAPLPSGRHSREGGNPARKLDSGQPAAPGMTAFLDGVASPAIHADLTTGDGLNLSLAKPLAENANIGFQGPEKNGAFDITGELARQWLNQPNPNNLSNSDIIKPRYNGLDLARRYSDGWVIDYGTSTTEVEASLYELPFQHVVEHVKPERENNKDRNRKKYWWRFGRTGEDMRTALKGLPRYIATPHVSKHRFFVWMDACVLADKMLIVIARADDATFGILHSRFHELWSLRLGTSLEDRPRYTPTTTFETYPFPAGLTPRDTASGAPSGPLADAIASAAKRLNTLRENWLNPPEWVDWVITPEEEKAGFPKRPVAKPGHEAELKKRTLTNLYNTKLAGKAAWLDNAHKALDAAVAAAYGWADYSPAMSDDEILRRLLSLNLERAAT